MAGRTARGTAAVAEVLRGQAVRAVGGQAVGGDGDLNRRRGFALEELSLRHNGCGDAGVAALAAAITDVAKVGGENRRGGGGGGGAGLLDDDRYTPHVLRVLRLGFNGITAVGAAHLATALCAARAAAAAALGPSAADAVVVQTLDLACNSLGPSGGAAVAGAMDCVEDLDLGRGLHSSTFQLNLSRVRHTRTPYTP